MRNPQRDRLIAIARRSPEHARARLLSAAADADTAPDACWVQTVIPPDATPQQLAQARNELRRAAREAREAPGRGWVRPVEVEDEITDHGQRLLTIYIFRAS